MLIYRKMAKMVVKTSKKRCKNIAEKFGGKEKVRIFAARLRNNGKFTDNTERDNEVKKIEIRKSVSDNTRVNSYMSVAAQFQGNEKRMRSGASRTWSVVQRTKREGYKSERWMPRLLEAKKDAVSCENLRVTANM